jgi:predicted enzyme related to lactoylglutathione lyase
MAAQPIVHIELVTPDPKAAGQFYQEVFGWTLDLDPTFDYLQFKGEGGPGGAFIKPDNDNAGANAVIYLDSDDIDADLGRVQAAGGQVVVPKTEIPQSGWFAIFSDPSGSRMALYQSIHAHPHA